MSNKNYVSGRKFEYKVRDYLRKKKYYVIRSAGSKSMIDLVAIPLDRNGMHRCLFIQCKHNSSALPKKSVIRKFLIDHANIRFMLAYNEDSAIYFSEYRLFGPKNELFDVETEIW